MPSMCMVIHACIVMLDHGKASHLFAAVLELALPVAAHSLALRFCSCQVALGSLSGEARHVHVVSTAWSSANAS